MAWTRPMIGTDIPHGRAWLYAHSLRHPMTMTQGTIPMQSLSMRPRRVSV